MPSEYRADPILMGRDVDPAVQEGIRRVEYPEYLIAEALSGDGIKEVHRRISGEVLTADAAATAITEMIVERLTEDIPDESEGGPPSRTAEHTTSSPFIPNFPKPVISRLFGKRRDTPAEDPVFEHEPPRVNFHSPLKVSLLMRAEAVTQQWRQGKINDDRAVVLLERLVTDYRKHQQRQ